MKKQLIINADDFGLDSHTYEWTVRLFETGTLTSATIMAGMPATAQAVAYALKHPEFSFGIHFCLVDERPLSDPKLIPTLVDPATGRLWATRQFIVRNFLARVAVADLVTEMRAQYRALAALGFKPTHADGHGHNHRLPQALKALQQVRDELGLRTVRRCQDLNCGRPGLLSRLINGPMQRRLKAAGWRMTDHFLMNAGHSSDPDWFRQALERLPDGVTEIGIHPGRDEEWRRIDTEGPMCYNFKDRTDIELTNFNRI